MRTSLILIIFKVVSDMLVGKETRIKNSPTLNSSIAINA